MSLFTPNTDQIEGFYEKGKFLMIWRLMILFGVMFSLLSIIAFTPSYSIQQHFAFLCCVCLSLVSLVYLKKTQDFKSMYYFIAIVGCTLVSTILNGVEEILHIGNFLWQVLIIMFTFFGLGKKAGLVVSIIVIVNITYYFLFSVENNINHITDLGLSVRLGLVIEVITAILLIAYLIQQFVIVHDYANKELQAQNSIISNQNIEKTTLVQEVHHRVKNNLQIIISLLRLQKKEIKSDETKKHFTEAINRVLVMASIHQKLYKDKSFTQIVLKDYLTELTDDIVTLSSSKDEIKINVVSEIDNIGLKTIVPLGLIVNELVSNSIQHAFSKTGIGTIDVAIKIKENNHFELIYKDTGIWIEPAESYSSFGLELIAILVSQLEGTFERRIDEVGTNYNFKLINLD